MPLDTNVNRPEILFYSLAVGAFIGVLYTVFELLYGVLCEYGAGARSKMFFRIVLDILFSLLYTLVAVVFVFGVSNGNVRFYVLFFALAGFVIYNITLGRLIYRILLYVLGFFVRLSKKVFSAITYPMRKLFEAIKKKACSNAAVRYVYHCVNGGLG